jgi:hypothetical protein
MNVKAAEHPKFFGFHASFLIEVLLQYRCRWGFFQSNGKESRKIFIFAALTFISLIFRFEILYAKYVDLLDKLEEVKKSNFFDCA